MFDYQKALNPRVARIKPSGIRKYFDIAATMEDVVSLGVGEPDFVTPQHIMQAGIDSLLAGKTQYTANAGILPLRKAVSNYLETRFGVSYHPDSEVLITVGGSEAIDVAFRALIAEGDEVLLPQPSFVCYESLIELCGGKPVIINTRKEDSFKLTPEQIKNALTPKTKLLILSYPNNPTGAVMTRDELAAIAKVLEDTNVVVVSDEIYAELSYGLKHTAFSAVPGMWERTILVSGFSKAFAMTGWRLGYCCGPKELMMYLLRAHQHMLMCASSPAQYAALEALEKGMPDVEYMVGKYDERRKYLYTALTGLGFDCFEPQGAFYIFPDVSMFAENGTAFVEDLLVKQRVAVVPGDAFGQSGKNHVRISYAYSLEALKIAMDRIEKYIKAK